MFELSRVTGTSLAMLDRTYGHMRADSLDRARSALDTFGHGEAKRAMYSFVYGSC
jgi:hypothetical protein